MHFPWVIDVSVTKKNDNSKNFPSRVIDIGWIYIHVVWGGGLKNYVVSNIYGKLHTCITIKMYLRMTSVTRYM